MSENNNTVGGKLRYGMVGGKQGHSFGNAHMQAINRDGLAEIAAGCFSRSYETTLSTGAALGIGQDRLYKTFEEMAEAESKRADRIDFVIIVTPNASHYPAAKAFLERGFSVVCDKPLTVTSAQATELAELAKRNKLLFGVSYTYTGYAAVKQAREMIRRGDIGDIRFINAEYPQGWLAGDLPKTGPDGQKLDIWRLNPELSGISACVADIGTHLENLIAAVSGLSIKSLCARLDTFGAGRLLDDNAVIMVEYRGGAKGVYWSSQIAAGMGNGLRFRIFGTRGSLFWVQEDPSHLEFNHNDVTLPPTSIPRDTPYYPEVQAFLRPTAEGKSEEILDSLANIYRVYITALQKRKAGQPLTQADLDFPNAEEGYNGMRFIEKCVESSGKGAVWVDY
ncbi:oxidoreductase [Spirochaetia bacterium]|nr:oxidoreductase [Spirochaetia bacterium]